MIKIIIFTVMAAALIVRGCVMESEGQNDD